MRAKHQSSSSMQLLLFSGASFLLSVRVELLFDIRTQECKVATPPTFDVVHVLVVAVL